MRRHPTPLPTLLLALALAAPPGCALRREAAPAAGRATAPERGAQGTPAPAAGAGAVVGAVLGEGELDPILAGDAVGDGLGDGLGAYIDRQEEKLARIPGTTVERIGEDMLRLRFESDLLFEVDSARLDDEARAGLDQAASAFVEQPQTAILAQGHTDSSGGEAHNRALSERRAAAVRDYLVGSGVDAARIAARGYGETHPVADNASAAGRRANRRVDLLIKAKRH